ncbi:unnamed protein product [Pocillopora meandrina]|uniref:Uncharacterized protein n=1 Tax=Pocillopora meandrina TaxID=46732 RepID=A0AAU9X6G9_9CNID|nr:unnamed protein product [Pocillopora meandrina]
MCHVNWPVLRKVKLKGEATLEGEYNTAVKQQGVTRSLEIKWEENRGKILAELTMNRTKKNTGDAKPMKQRERIAKDRSSCTDKYPLPSNLLLAKFKLRRAAGSKVSKLWLKRKQLLVPEIQRKTQHITEEKDQLVKKKKTGQKMAGIRSRNSKRI